MYIIVNDESGNSGRTSPLSAFTMSFGESGFQNESRTGTTAPGTSVGFTREGPAVVVRAFVGPTRQGRARVERATTSRLQPPAQSTAATIFGGLIHEYYRAAA
jgi:hypothetical protein